MGLLIPVSRLPECGGRSKMIHRDGRIVDIRESGQIRQVPGVGTPEPLQVLGLQGGLGQAERIDNAVVGAAEVEHGGWVQGEDSVAREAAGVALRAFDGLGDRYWSVIVG